jgi:hypothetical protein
MTTYPANMENADGSVRLAGEIEFTSGTNQPQPNVNPVTSGALPTVQLVSTTGAQVSTTRSVTTVTPVTYDASAADAKLKVEISPDNSTYSTLGTVTVPFATQPVNGLIELLTLPVPAGWYVKLTTTHATLGASSYY